MEKKAGSRPMVAFRHRFGRYATDCTLARQLVRILLSESDGENPSKENHCRSTKRRCIVASLSETSASAPSDLGHRHSARLSRRPATGSESRSRPLSPKATMSSLHGPVICRHTYVCSNVESAKHKAQSASNASAKMANNAELLCFSRGGEVTIVPIHLRKYYRT